MRKVFIFCGQSNCSAYGIRQQLFPVPTWAQTSSHGWTGAPTVSHDAPYRQYVRPMLTDFPCLANENVAGANGFKPFWGRYEGERQTAAGVYSEAGSYGPELSFLRNYQDEHPEHSIAYIKHALGGSSLANDWMPGKPLFNTLQTTIEWATASLTLMGESWEWELFTWGHGESGAHTANVTSTKYLDDARVFFAAVRALTGKPDLHISVRRISDQYLSNTALDTSLTYGSLPLTEANRAAYRAGGEWRRTLQAQLGSDPNCSWYDTDGLPPRLPQFDSTGYHHSGPGVLADGERGYRSVYSPIEPPPPIPLVVNFNGSAMPWSVKLNGANIGGEGDVIDVEGGE